MRTIVLFAVFFASCGIDRYSYLEPIENVSTAGVTSAQITLPSQPAGGDFRNYTIYYRIYLSSISITSQSQLDTVNTQLTSDYNAVYPYTSSDTLSPNAVGTLLEGRGYYPLYVESGGSIQAAADILNSPSSLTLRLTFSSSASGGVTLYYSGTGTTYQMRRSNDNGNFTSYPNTGSNYRTFYASPDLLNDALITANANRDIQKPSSGSSSYAYVSMYLIATGIDQNFTTLYSRPKHIGIFSLPSP